MHNITLLINITVALAGAFIGGLIARRLGIPVIVGYLLAGIAIGPFTPGFVGDVETIGQLAELGVIFLMFGVGLHFSFNDLAKVRHIAVPGAIGQMLLAAVLAYLVTQTWGWEPIASIVLGLSISVASTVVLLRNLMDRNLLNTPAGQASVGWLVMEDLATIFILILMPALAQQDGSFQWQTLTLTLLKASAFIALMFFVGKRGIPWLLGHVVRTGSRELFILGVLVIALSTAMGAAELFSVSLALGAFAAGAIISESPLSYQVGADVLPFREAFAILFFVSVGMLVNPSFLFANVMPVLAITAIVVVGKALITLLLGFVIPGHGHIFLVVAAGLSQIGEFSFIVGQAGLALNMIDRNQYSIILAAALFSIAINPVLFRMIPTIERALHRVPWVWKQLNKQERVKTFIGDPDVQPVVIVGYGRVGAHLVNVLGTLEIPIKLIEMDVEKIALLNKKQIPTVYGDAANSEVLMNLGLDNAKALVISLSEEAATEVIVRTARVANPLLPIIARAGTEDGILRLAGLGATFIIHPELEGGLEMVRHTLLQLGFPRREVDGYAEEVRHKQYEALKDTNAQPLVKDILRAVGEIEISWLEMPPTSPLIGHSLAETNLRGRTGASLVALVRDHKLSANPKSSTVFVENDRIGVIGEPDQIKALEQWINGGKS
ncbi:MAG: cation:proton antiporter [Anaerolineales bacterium]